MLHRPRSPAKEGLSRTWRLPPPSQSSVDNHGRARVLDGRATSDTPHTPHLRAQPIRFAIPSSERLLHGRARSNRNRPYPSRREKWLLLSALLPRPRGSVPYPKRSPTRPIPPYTQVRSNVVGLGPTHIRVPMRHRRLLVLRAAPTLPRSTTGKQSNHAGPSAMRVRPNPSLQRTRYARR